MFFIPMGIAVGAKVGFWLCLGLGPDPLFLKVGSTAIRDLKLL